LRQQWRKDAWSSIKQFAAITPTHPALLELLFFLVNEWKIDSVIDADDYHHDLKTLLAWRFKIGWL
jgi:hypothetical protein